MKLQGKEWMNVWAGTWSFLTCTHFADQYSKEIKINGKVPFPETIIFFEKGKSACWITQQTRDDLGAHVVSTYGKSLSSIEGLCKTLKKKVDGFLGFADDKKNWKPDKYFYDKMWNTIVDYYSYHIAVKYIVDYLPEDKLKKYFHYLEEARVYAEPVFKVSEDFVRSIVSQISKSTSYSEELLLCLTKKELDKFFKTKKLPNKKILKNRHTFSSIFADNRVQTITNGPKARKIFKTISFVKKTNAVHGQSAFNGKVKGVVRIIFDPSKYETFSDSEILVTGMTRPEFLHLMQKAGAIITDSGGILSHAAITARELKKPCIIGTKIATKVLKDGDLVEVDANVGTVKIIKKA